MVPLGFISLTGDRARSTILRDSPCIVLRALVGEVGRGTSVAPAPRIVSRNGDWLDCRSPIGRTARVPRSRVTESACTVYQYHFERANDQRARRAPILQEYASGEEEAPEGGGNLRPGSCSFEPADVIDLASLAMRERRIEGRSVRRCRTESKSGESTRKVAMRVDSQLATRNSQTVTKLEFAH